MVIFLWDISPYVLANTAQGFFWIPNEYRIGSITNSFFRLPDWKRVQDIYLIEFNKRCVTRR